MKRRNFLRGSAALLGFAPITPLTPIINTPATTAFPLPFATAAPATTLNGTPSTAVANGVPVYLAVVGPETGPQIDLQRQVEYGVRGAIADGNAHRAPLDRTLDVHLFDDLGVATDARVAAGSAVADAGVMAAIGHLGSATTIAALETYAQAQLALLVPVSSNDAVTAHGYRNIFRLPTRDSLEGQLFARYLLKHHDLKRVAVIMPTDGYGPEVGAAFANACAASGIVAQTVRVPVIATESEMQTLLTPLLSPAPDLVFFAGTGDALSHPAKVFLQTGCKALRTASQGFFSVGTITQLGPYGDGFMVSSSMPPLSRSAQSALQIEAFRESYGDLTPVAAFAYAAAQIIITALRSVGAVSRVPLTQAIVHGGTFTTLVGDFRFDDFGDPIQPNLYFYTIENGAWVASGSLRPTQFR